MVSKSQLKATAKFNAANYDAVKIRVKKGTRDIWKASAEKAGKSLAQLIVEAVTEYIENECL